MNPGIATNSFNTIPFSAVNSLPWGLSQAGSGYDCFFKLDRWRATLSAFRRSAECCRMRSTIWGCLGNRRSGR